MLKDFCDNYLHQLVSSSDFLLIFLKCQFNVHIPCNDCKEKRSFCNPLPCPELNLGKAIRNGTGRTEP